MNKNQLKQHLQLSTYMEIDSVKYYVMLSQK